MEFHSPTILPTNQGSHEAKPDYLPFHELTKVEYSEEVYPENFSENIKWVQQLVLEGDISGAKELGIKTVQVYSDADESSLAVGLVVLPPALVHGAIWPDLFSLSLSDIFADNPLSVVSCMVL